MALPSDRVGGLLKPPGDDLVRGDADESLRAAGLRGVQGLGLVLDGDAPRLEGWHDIDDDEGGAGVGLHVAEFAGAGEVVSGDVDGAQLGVVGPADWYDVRCSSGVGGGQPA